MLKWTKIDTKNAQKPDSVLGPSRGGFWGRFWSILGIVLGPFFGVFWHDFQQFLRICTNTRRYKQKGAKTHKIRANAGRYLQIRADTCKYAQIRAGTRTYVQKRANTWKHIQIHTDTRKYRVTNAARERAQRAQRAKCRKDTASSYAQLQGAPFSSVRRHVPASLIMITRFPFTYQTGF